MLKGILFDIAPEVAGLRKLSDALESAEIKYLFCLTHTASTGPVSFSSSLNTLALSPKDCLVLTDSAAGISSSRSAGIPCIGYAPQGCCENLSGAYALFEDFASIDIAYLCRTHAHAVGYPADILSTERLTVREFSETDFPALYAMCTKPSTASFMEEQLSDFETEKEKHNAYIHYIYPFFDLALWGVYEKSSGTLIGRAGFSLPEDDSETFSLGYLIDVPYRKQGFAKELIPALLSYAKDQGYTKVFAHIMKKNIGSVKALEQCGFPYKCKESVDILIYTIPLD